MKIYTNTYNLKKIREYGLGLLINPISWKDKEFKDIPCYAVDNGAYTCYIKNKPFNDGLFLNLVNRLRKYPNPEFIVLPDIVAGGMSSFFYSLGWYETLPKEFRYYLALQDGMDLKYVFDRVLDFSRIKGVFVGGTMKWKLKNSPKIVKTARENNLKVHIGRIGTVKNMVYCNNLGVDSIDGNNISINNKWSYLEDYKKQKTIFEEFFDYNKGMPPITSRGT